MGDEVRKMKVIGPAPEQATLVGMTGWVIKAFRANVEPQRRRRS